MRILHIYLEEIGKHGGGIESVLIPGIIEENKSQIIESKILGIKENLIKKIDFKYILDYKNWKKEIKSFNPDFIIFHGFYILNHIKISNFLKNNNIKYFIKPHGSFSKVNYSKNKLKKEIAWKIIFTRFVRMSSGIIYLNDNEQKSSISLEQKRYYLPNGIYLDDNKLKNKIVNKGISVMYLGRIEIYYKGLDILLDELFKIKKYLIEEQIFFYFYGYGSEKNIKIFEEKISKISEIARYYGKLEGEEKSKKFLENDLFILNSRTEGMPMVLLEALSYKLPCIISKSTNFEHEIKKNDLGWIIEEYKGDWLKMFKDIKENKERILKEIDRKSYECLSKFYWKNLIDIYEKEYKRMNFDDII